MARNISGNTGRGKDRKGTKRDGLERSWKWVMQCGLSKAPPSDKRRLPCQSCFAEIRTELGYWKFRAVDWHDSYEAQVHYNGKHLLSHEGFATRLEAQRRAEVLVKVFCEAALLELYSE